MPRDLASRYREPLYSNSEVISDSSRGGCSRGVHKIVNLAVKKGNILVNFLLLKKFIVNYYHY